MNTDKDKKVGLLFENLLLLSHLFLTTKHAKGAKKGMDIVCKEESYRIIGACFEVCKEKGNGFLEAVYIEHERFVNQSSPNAFGEDFSRLSRVS